MSRHERHRLERIADLEYELGIGGRRQGWWSLVPTKDWDYYDGSVTRYEMPEIERRYRAAIAS